MWMAGRSELHPLRAASPVAERVAAVVGAELAPLVDRIDSEGFYPESVLRRLGEAGAFSAHVGGLHDGPARLFDAIDAMARVAEHCLATAFCTWCQDAFAWYVANTGNEPLRTRLLEGAATGRLLGGTGLSNPMKALAGIEPLRLRGEAVRGGYVVNGSLPWVSNLGPGGHFGTVFGVERHGRHVMALVDTSLDGIRLGAAPRLLALEGTRTFAVHFRDAFIPDSLVLADPAEPFIARVKAGFVLLQAGMGLGLIRGCITLMERADRSLGHVNRFLQDRPPLFQDALERLSRDVAELAVDPFDGSRTYVRRVLEARLAISEWTLRAAQSAMLHAGARAYVARSAPQRRLREAYFVAIVTPATKHLRQELAALG
jgi:alkylation response protein AidB-like acyl-CoA dehydrogenase